jgi:hypothetical protein
MKAFPLTAVMHNDATVSDWLGTAHSAAQRGANDIKEVRNMSPDHDLNMFTSRAKLRHAQQVLAQALDEVTQVIDHVEGLRVDNA